MENFDLERPLTQGDSTIQRNSVSSRSDEVPALAICVRKLLWDSIPNVIYLLSFHLITTMNMLYVSNNAKEEDAADIIAGVGIAGTWISITTLLIVISLNIGTSTLASQAYGSKNMELVGLYLHRSLILRLIGLVPSFILLYYCDDLLMFLGISARSVTYAGVYARACMPAVFLYTISDAIKSYITAHNIFTPVLYMQSVLVVVHFLLCEVLIRHMQLKFGGLGLAFFLSQAVGVAMYSVYIIKYMPTEGSLFWFKKESFQNLLPQLNEEVWIGLVVYIEWVCYEVMLILAGNLGDIELRSLIICYNLLTFLDMAGTGLGVTLTTYIASAMGEGSAEKVKQYIRACLVISAVYIASVSALLLSSPGPLIRIFTNEPETVKLTTTLLTIEGFGFVFDIAQIMAVAVLKGIGQEVEGTKFYIFSIFGWGVPIAYLLAFICKFGAVGLYCGITCGFIMMNFLCLRVLKTVDFRSQIAKINERILYLSTTGEELKTIEMRSMKNIEENN
mmetsp:Transcript_53724/g.61688  ORF Transcript_53724/g.61688 Transcript_53724/m.61688 type:complete len:505 (+) Transcript_53724:51-1565(+)